MTDFFVFFGAEGGYWASSSLPGIPGGIPIQRTQKPQEAAGTIQRTQKPQEAAGTIQRTQKPQEAGKIILHIIGRKA